MWRMYRLCLKNLQQKIGIKEKKRALFLPEVEFSGHEVSAEGVKVAVDKIDAVSSWPTPMCVREV